MTRCPGRNAAAAMISIGFLAACDTRAPVPPPSIWFDGLPVSGNLADARRAGFNACISFNTDLHCRRYAVTIVGQGPYDAAVDLVGGDGSGGFYELTLWSEKDPDGVYAIADALKAQGWRECFAGGPTGGDQAIYTRPRSPVFVSMDLSYWGTRRLRVIPSWTKKQRSC